MNTRRRAVLLLQAFFVTCCILTTIRTDGRTREGATPAHAAPADTSATRETIAELKVGAVAFNATHAVVFVPTTGEFCPSDGTPSLKSVDLATGRIDEITNSCDFSVHEIVATSSFIYYTNSRIGPAPDRKVIDEIRVERADGHSPPLNPGESRVIANGNGLLTHRGLAIDSGFLYWGDANGIQRVDVLSRAVTVIAPDGRSLGIAVDATDVYWIEGGPGHGAVMRVPKAGGTPETIVAGEDLDYPGSVAVDDTHIYWSELGSGLVRRIAKSGDTSIVDYGSRDPSQMAHSVALTVTDVFWMVTGERGDASGRLLRAAKDAPGSATELDNGLFGARKVAPTTQAFYADYHGVYRLPLDATAAEPNNLSIEAIEVTQGIQNLANDVQLVADKPTFVRVYPRASKSDVVGVTGRLRGFRGGAELVGSPLTPLKAKVDVYQWGWSRGALNGSFNYVLPSDWLRGDLDLEAEVNLAGEGAIAESNRADNVLRRTVDYKFVPAPCIRVMSIRTHIKDSAAEDSGTHGGTYDSSSRDFDEIVARFESLTPISKVVLLDGFELAEIEGSWWPPSIGYGPYEFEDDQGWIMAKLMKWRILSAVADNLICKSANGFSASTHMMGTVHPMTDGIKRAKYEGLGNYGVNASFVSMFNDHNASAKPFGEPGGGWLMAHEIGHNYVGVTNWIKGESPWYHVPCRATEDLNWKYPYKGDTDASGKFLYNHIGLPGRDSHWGFDLLSRTTIAPYEASDYMGYCGPQWVSDYRWSHAIDAFSEFFGSEFVAQKNEHVPAARSETSQAAEVLTVIGVYTPTTGTASFTDLFRLPSGVLAEPLTGVAAGGGLAGVDQAVPAELRLVGDGGNVLASQPVDLSAEHLSNHVVFAASTPFRAGTATVQLVRGNRVIAARTVSRSAPTVRVTAPNGGETISDRLTVSWTAADADPPGPDNALRYIVEYSADGGRAWVPISQELAATTWTTSNTQHLPGSDGQSLIRVIASDGVNATIDASDRPFSLQRHSPRVTILSPEALSTLPSETGVVLTGRADDTEDGVLDDSKLTWTVDGQPTGVGRMAASAALAPGEHKAVLNATDSDGRTGSAEVTFVVAAPECPNDGQLDAVFVVDTSNRMLTDQLPQACTFIAAAAAGLRERGLDVAVTALGVTSDGSCLHGTVRDAIPDSAVNHPSDWGQAVIDLAAHHPWRPGARRLIVPISDAGPADGNPVQDPGADRDAIAAAIAAAVREDVTVAPLVIAPKTTATTLLDGLARDLAVGTGGTVLQLSDGAAALVANIGPSMQGSACQAGLYVAPATAVLQTAHDTVVEIRARGMRQLYGIQVELSFGRDVAEVVDADPAFPGVQIEPGDLLAPQPQVLRNSASNSRGTIEFSASLQGAQAGVDGDGVVARIRFRGKAAGTTPLTFTRANLSDPQSQPMTVERRDGLLIVRAESAGELPFTVTGKVTLERRTRQAGARVCDGANCATTGADGTFTLAGVKLNDTVVVSHASYLQSERKIATPPSAVGGTVTLPDVKLLGGDVDQSRQIYAADAVEVAKSWNAATGEARYLAKVDITDDGQINIFDMVAVQFNFAQRAPGPWAAGVTGQAAALDAPLPATHVGASTAPGDGGRTLRSRLGGWASRLGLLAEPVVRLDPAEAKGMRSAPVRVDLRVEDVSKLFAFNVKLRFDPTMLRVRDANPNRDGVQLLVGEFLDVENLIVVHNEADNVKGEAQLVVTETNPAVGQDGSGILGTILFDGLRGGRSEVTFIETELFDDGFPGAATIAARTVGGAVVVEDRFTILAPFVVRGWPQP